MESKWLLRVIKKESKQDKELFLTLSTQAKIERVAVVCQDCWHRKKKGG